MKTKPNLTLIFFLLFPAFLFAQNVGIGTTNPTYKLDIYDGDLRLGQTSVNLGGASRRHNALIRSNSGYNLIRLMYEGYDGGYWGNLYFGPAGPPAITPNSGFNVGIGGNALRALTTGSNNLAVGWTALYDNTTGSFNVAVGTQSVLRENTTGSQNIGIGNMALRTNLTGSRNFAAGFQAGYSSQGDNNIYLGYKAGYYETGSNKLYIENSDSTTPLIYGDFTNDTVKIYGALSIADTYSLPTNDGLPGQVLTTDGAGNISWTNPAPAAPTTYTVGDFAQGGIVFWVDETGEHGLVCAKEDDINMTRWFAGTNGETQALGDGPYAGEANTIIIISSQVALGDDGQNYAARICNELVISESLISYGDWYLPSYEELAIMNQHKTVINATAAANAGYPFKSASYWSSTESNPTDAWTINFMDDTGYPTTKSLAHYVRPIRAF